MEPLDIAIVVSKLDPAGMNIYRCLLARQSFPSIIAGKRIDLFARAEELVQCDNIDKEIPADVFVFASKHVSKAGVHSLTVHSIGNFGAANLGGKARTLVPVPAALMQRCFQMLSRASGRGYEVIQEATHHGPFLEKEAMFIEIGSGPAQWADDEAGFVVADALLKAITLKSRPETAIGIGGLHHTPNFRNLMLENTAVAYLCPKHQLAQLDESLVRQMLEKADTDLVIVDWKGIGSEKQRILGLLTQMGVQVKRTKDYSKNINTSLGMEQL